MPAAANTCRYEAFAFIEELERLSSADEVVGAMERAFARFGFKNLLLTGLPARFEHDAILGARWPQEFIELYVRQNWMRVDPLAQLCRRSIFPFEWNAESFFHGPEPRAVDLMHSAADFRLKRGFVIPIHGPDGYEAVVSMAATDYELPPYAKPALHLMALYGFERVRSLHGASPEQSPRLTSREREVLTWSAQGKSAWEIGEILHIAKRTVDEHAQTAFRKLGAANRTQAVAIALRDRIISL